MICFPICKINIGLRILEKCPDGYHNIESVFYPVKISDALEFVVAKQGSTNDTLIVSGLQLTDSNSDNIILRAVRRFREEADIPFLNIHLHKNIYIGAGLGGGSSDAAYIIKSLNNYFCCGFDHSHLEMVAADIGSDCPFFIQATPKLIKGRGEIMSPISLSLDKYCIRVSYPNISVSTREAYMHCTPRKRDNSLEELINQPIAKWRDTIENDFETYLFARYPEIEQLKKNFYSEGAIYSSLTGSGSAVYGIFSK